MKRAGLTALTLLAWFAGVAALILREEPAASGNERADAAIVLGAALRPDGTPSPVFAGRLEHAVQLLRTGRVRRLVLTGGKGEGLLQSEAAAGRAWAIARAVPAAAILIEERSHTTRQNLVEARSLMTRARLRTAFIVSDPLHLPRSLRMARGLGLRAQAAPTPSSRYRSWRTRLPFLARESFFLTGYWLTGR